LPLVLSVYRRFSAVTGGPERCFSFCLALVFYTTGQRGTEEYLLGGGGGGIGIDGADGGCGSE
jgi:hypothetical protein